MPLAPGLFSITTCIPSALVALSAKARITASVDPPAGQGQISLMGRAGKAWAWASDGNATVTAAAAVACTKWRRVASWVFKPVSFDKWVNPLKSKTAHQARGKTFGLVSGGSLV
jgi:hypothetical protein